MSAGVFKPLMREAAPLATLKDAERAHDPRFLAHLASQVPEHGRIYLDSDTVLSPQSLNAALYAVGGAMRGIDAVFNKDAQNAFIAARPPGHHAESNCAMGFCLINTVAVAARYALEKYNCERIAIVDWDVHHGNGTQEIFWGDKRIMYASSHEMPLFPGTGKASETGEHDNIVNAPLAPQSGSAEFKDAFTSIILPRVRAFSPDHIIISAGFDAHTLDPLGSLNLDETDFAWATYELMHIADDTAQGRLISVLEGGYDLIGLSKSVSAHVQALMRIER
jgi:acetoin utilization deacetylase AcuC-like enzyme